MRKEPDEIELEILKYVVDKPGCKMMESFASIIGKPRKETFLYGRVKLLLAEGYLELRHISPGKRRLFPSKKTIKLVQDQGNGEASK
jgi:hypothetical protein